jgi:antitoxin (DNA-binding transcriptional repressor) of toxin-antitoxin stability system
MMSILEIADHELRDHTIAILRRAEAGERMRVTVDRRPVAQLGPIERDYWTSGPAMELVLERAPSDAALLADLASVRRQIVE